MTLFVISYSTFYIFNLFSCFVILVSDTCSGKTAIDSSGPLISELIQETFKSNQISYQIIPDDCQKIEETLKYFSDILNVDVIFTTGGTGFSMRDVTPEATKRVIDREAPQLANYMFIESLKKTKFAVLSRAICGIRNQTLIINFPGSKKAVQECFEAISDVIPHAVQLIRDEKSLVKQTHSIVQHLKVNHVCPHKTGTGGDDRSSKYPMIEV